MASQTLPPHHEDAQLMDKVEEGKTVEQEISLPPKEDVETDEGKVLKCVASSGPEDSAIKLQEKSDDKQLDSFATAEAEKVHDNPESHEPEVDVPIVAASSDSKVDEVEMEQETQSSLSDPPESSSAEAGKKLVEHLKEPLIQERPSEHPEMEKEAEEGNTTASKAEEKLQEGSDALEELKKKQDLELVEKPEEQTGVEKKEALEAKQKPSEQMNILEEKLQEQIGDLQGGSGKELTSIIERQLASEAGEMQHDKIEVLEGETKKTLGSEVEEKPQEQTGVAEELDQKVTLGEETKTQHPSVLEEMKDKPEISESKEPAVTGIAEGVGVLNDKIMEASESLKEEHNLSIDEPENAPLVAEKGVSSDVIDGVDDTNNEQSGTDVAKGLAGEFVEVGKMEETKNLVDESASQSAALNSVEASDFPSPVEASKEPIGGEKASGDGGVTDEENKEIKVKFDFDPVHSTDTKELSGEPKKLDPSFPEQSREDKLDKVVEPVEETLNSEVTNLEPSKEVSDLKTEEVGPKVEAAAKPTQKQSNNILSKVKHSIGKVKKAITGRSPSSKTISVDAKADVNVK